MTTSIPIACTLDAGAYADRVAWIAALNRDALRASRQRDLTLELTYDPSAAERVRELVRREQACCAFLSFGLKEAADGLVLRIVAPEKTRDAVDAFFAPFLATEGDTAPVPMAGACASGTCACAPPAGGSSAHGLAAAEGADGGDAGGGRVASVAAGTGAVAALACGVCCVLPLALPAALLSTFGGVIALAAHAYWWALGAAAALVGAGWTWVGWRSARSRRRPSRSTMIAMGGATVLLGVAWSWSLAERYVAAALRS